MSTAPSGNGHRVASEILDRLPPQDLAAEMNLLGSIGLESSILPDVGRLVQAAHFYAEAHQIIYWAFLDIHEIGGKIDITRLVALLKENGTYDKVGGAAYLAEVLQSVPYATNWRYYAEIVKEKAARRNGINAATEALRDLWNEGIPVAETVSHVTRSLTNIDQAGDTKRSLPQIRDAFDLCETDVPLPSELIQGLLHQGSKLSFSGASKGYKTWALDSLALSVAYGLRWLGCETRRAKVLLIDLELQEAFCRRRLLTLSSERALNISRERGRLDVWNLRGFAVGHQLLLPQIEERIGNDGYGLVIVDPIYKLYADGSNENAAADVAALMNSLERLCSRCNAAVAFGAHYSKGNQAGKEAIDRISGSGVFARDPDSLLNLTAHEQPDCYTVEATLRNFPPMEPFVVRWAFPLFVRDTTLDPAALKKIGRPPKYTADALLAVLVDGMTSGEWEKAGGMSNEVYLRLRRELENAFRVTQVNQRWEKSR